MVQKWTKMNIHHYKQTQNGKKNAVVKAPSPGTDIMLKSPYLEICTLIFIHRKGTIYSGRYKI